MKKLLVLVGLAVALGAVWRFTALAELAHPDQLAAYGRVLRANGLVYVLAPFLFVLLSTTMFPLVVLRLSTILVLGPFLGALYAIAGVALCALVGHAIGTRLGSEALERWAPRRLAQIRAFTSRRSGILAVAALRLVPLGPFMLVNTAAGAANLRRRDFVVGTVLGLMPGLIVIVTFVLSAGA